MMISALLLVWIRVIARWQAATFSMSSSLARVITQLQRPTFSILLVWAKVLAQWQTFDKDLPSVYN